MARSATLLDGNTMPMLGLGTWDLRDTAGAEAIARALDMGYRHLDTAFMYDNQQAVGRGIRASGVPRDEIFVTTKITKDSLRPDDVRAQHAENLELLGFDSVELLLVHWPNDDIPIDETMGAFADLVDAGQTRSVGVSNFSEAQIDAAVAACRYPIVTNQVRYNVLDAPDALRAHCQAKDITITAYTPTTKGDASDQAAVSEAAAAHGKTATQVCLRWLVQQDLIVIPRSASAEHQRENMDLFDWELSDAEMAALEGIAE